MANSLDPLSSLIFSTLTPASPSLSSAYSSSNLASPTKSPTSSSPLTSTPPSLSTNSPLLSSSSSLLPSSAPLSTPSPSPPLQPNSPTATLASFTYSNSLASPSLVPSASPPTPTVFRTVTQGSGPTASVVVITQTALLPAATDSSAISNGSHSSSQNSNNSGKSAAIAIPSAIGGFILLLVVIFSIRSLMNRISAARAADDIRWPETVTSEGDRAALYPEPTRPSAGHGLGLAEEDQGPETINMAGAGAGGLRHGPSNATSLAHSDTTSAPASANHYLPFEYAPAPEFGYPYAAGPSHLPLPLPGSSTATNYGLNTSQNGSSQMPTYPPDWRDTQRAPYGKLPDAIPPSGPRTSHLHNLYATTDTNIEPDFGQSIFQHPSFSQQHPYNFAPQPSFTHYANSPPNDESGPREIQYAPYPHGGYGVETEPKESSTKDSAEGPPSPTEIQASPEWKLAINNPDTH